jgi:hypothetical protein
MNAIQNFFVMAFSELWGGFVDCVDWNGGCLTKNPAKVNTSGGNDRYSGAGAGLTIEPPGHTL